MVEVVTPQMGNCTIFARYVEAAFATQVILTARLTRLYEREDWEARLTAIQDKEPLMLVRGVAVKVQPTFAQAAKPQPQPGSKTRWRKRRCRQWRGLQQKPNRRMIPLLLRQLK